MCGARVRAASLLVLRPPTMPCRRGPHSAASLLSYEVPELPCIEVRVFWGNTLLRVDHLAPPRSYHVGEPSADTKVDFVVPKEKLGARGLQLIRSNGASPSVVIPAVACARVEQVGLRPVTLEKRVGRRDVGGGGGRKGKPCAAPPRSSCRYVRVEPCGSASEILPSLCVGSRRKGQFRDGFALRSS